MLGGSLLTINGTDVLKFDLPDSLKVELVADSLAVTGSIGRTVTVGTVKVGGVIPINIRILRRRRRRIRSSRSRLRRSRHRKSQ